MTGQFDGTDPENIVVRTQMAIAIYINPFGELVLRQEAPLYPDEDASVVIAPDNVPKVIEAMQQVMGIAAPTAVTKDPIAVDRQRRHRRKSRDAVTVVTVVESVTNRDGQANLPLAAE